MKSILATTDFTSGSKNAVECAAQLSIDLGARLILLHATPIPVVSDSFFDVGFTMDELEKTDRASMDELNESLRKKYGSDLKLEKSVKIGFTHELVSEQVKNGDISLVVMGITQGDLLTEVLFGSTSTALAGNLNCPVLIVPEKAKYRPISKMARAFDQKQIPTGTGMRIVKELFDHFKSTLYYVHVLDSPMGGQDEGTLKPIFKLFKDADPRVHFIQPTKNKTVEIIQDFSRRYKVNVLVMVSRQHSIFWKMVNERTTKKLAFHTSVPLLVLAAGKQHN